MKGRRFEVLTNKDGSKFEIRYVSIDETFYAVPEKGLEFRSANVTEVRKELEEYMRENDSLVWEPIIEIGSQVFGDDDILGLKYRRKFRAKKVDGTYLFRGWKTPNDSEIPEGEGMGWDDVLEGEPGATSCSSRYVKTILYKAERWAFLRRMTRTIKALRNAVEKFIEQDEAQLIECLEGRKVFNPTVGHLLAAPGDSEEEAEED